MTSSTGASSSNSSLRRRRRRTSRSNSARVPCETCIQRASERAVAAQDIELCEQCTNILHRPRRLPARSRQQQQQERFEEGFRPPSTRRRTDTAHSTPTFSRSVSHGEGSQGRWTPPPFQGHDSTFWELSEAEAQAIPMQHFETLSEARTALEPVLQQLIGFIHRLEEDTTVYTSVVASQAGQNLRCFPWLQAWERAFTDLLDRRRRLMSESERQGAMVLKARHLVAEIFSAVNLASGERAWDAFHGKFTAIVDLAGAALGISQLREENGLFGEVETLVNIDNSVRMGMVDALCEVCCRCRIPATRRRAIGLLTYFPRGGSSWRSWSAQKVDAYLNVLRPGDVVDPASLAMAGIQRIGAEARPRRALNPGLFVGYQREGSWTQLAQAAATADSGLWGLYGSDFSGARGMPGSGGGDGGDDVGAFIGETAEMPRVTGFGFDGETEQTAPPGWPF